MCRPLARCAFARHLKGTEERTEHFIVLFWYSLSQEENVPPPTSWVFSYPFLGPLPVSDLQVIWLFHKCLLLAQQPKGSTPSRKWQHLLDGHTIISQTWQQQLWNSMVFTATEGRAAAAAAHSPHRQHRERADTVYLPASGTAVASL